MKAQIPLNNPLQYPAQIPLEKLKSPAQNLTKIHTKNTRSIRPFGSDRLAPMQYDSYNHL
jgi:hypothetical protein